MLPFKRCDEDMSKFCKAHLEFVVREICKEYQTPQAEKVARILNDYFRAYKDCGFDSVTFGELTRTDNPKILVESHIQTSIRNALRDIELGLKTKRNPPAWIPKRKKQKT
jgi:hypothetical protein